MSINNSSSIIDVHFLSNLFKIILLKDFNKTKIQDINWIYFVDGIHTLGSWTQGYDTDVTCMENLKIGSKLSDLMYKPSMEAMELRVSNFSKQCEFYLLNLVSHYIQYLNYKSRLLEFTDFSTSSEFLLLILINFTICIFEPLCQNWKSKGQRIFGPKECCVQNKPWKLGL